MSQRYYLALVTILFISSSLVAMEKESFKPGYSIRLENSAEIVVRAAITNTRIKKEKIKKNKRIQQQSMNATEKPNPVTQSPNNMHRVFQQN